MSATLKRKDGSTVPFNPEGHISSHVETAIEACRMVLPRLFAGPFSLANSFLDPRVIMFRNSVDWEDHLDDGYIVVKFNSWYFIVYFTTDYPKIRCLTSVLAVGCENFQETLFFFDLRGSSLFTLLKEMADVNANTIQHILEKHLSFVQARDAILKCVEYPTKVIVREDVLPGDSEPCSLVCLEYTFHRCQYAQTFRIFWLTSRMSMCLVGAALKLGGVWHKYVREDGSDFVPGSSKLFTHMVLDPDELEDFPPRDLPGVFSSRDFK